MNPKVSVVISAYQKGKLLPRTIQSVLDQTFRDFELIVVDDGSTDNTREIVEHFAKMDNRIKYIYQENQGPGGARNTGIRHSSAELIALLDGDDMWYPDKLAYQVRVMDICPEIDLLFMNVHYTDTQNRQIGYRGSEYIQQKYYALWLENCQEVCLISNSDFPAKVLVKNVFILSTVIFRKRVWIEVGGFTEEFRGPEDLDFWVRSALKGCQFAYASHVSVSYYKNETSLVQPSESTYLEQLRHAIHVYSSPDYVQLRDAAQRLVQKRFRQLAVYYTYQQYPKKAWQMFRQSTLYGLSLRTFLIAITSFIGPIPLTIYGRFRRFHRPVRPI